MCEKCADAISLSKQFGYHGCGKIIYFDGDIHFCTGVKSHIGAHTTACEWSFIKKEVKQIDKARLETKIFAGILIVMVLWIVWKCL